MNKHAISLISILLLILLIGTLLVSCGSSKTTSSSGGSGGQSLMQQRCSVCHSLDRVTSAHKTAAEWTTTVQRMVSHGAQLNAQEQQTLIDYLAANYK
jgi:membrane protein involved in colicin uptake